jgi:hypothetical protein
MIGVSLREKETRGEKDQGMKKEKVSRETMSAAKKNK